MIPTMAHPNTRKTIQEKAADVIIRNYTEYNNKCDIPTDYIRMEYKRKKLVDAIKQAIYEIM